MRDFEAKISRYTVQSWVWYEMHCSYWLYYRDGCAVLSCAAQIIRQRLPCTAFALAYQAGTMQSVQHSAVHLS